MFVYFFLLNVRGEAKCFLAYALANDRQFDLVINATSAGLDGTVPDLPGELLTERGCCYDMVYGADEGRPEWMTTSRTYPLLNASGEAMSEFVREQSAAREASPTAAD